MKHTELNAIEYAGPRSSVSVLLSLVTTHAQAPTRRMHPTSSEAACAPMRCPASHVERAPMRRPSPHAPHNKRVVAHAPHVMPCKKDQCRPHLTTTVCPVFFLWSSRAWGLVSRNLRIRAAGRKTLRTVVPPNLSRRSCPIFPPKVSVDSGLV
jgi:hypothetical protein